MKSLYESVADYKAKGAYPFHMPGHKGNPQFMPPLHELLSLDITEIKGMDNLHAPTGCIMETQRRIADFYGAGESFLLVNGSTAGIISAICAVCGDGDKIAVARNCHRSVFSGMAWAGAHPVYFLPEIREDGLAGTVPAEVVAEVLDATPDAKAVILTSPTYEGFVSDISSIAKVAHDRGCVLIVDESHGAHFPFHSIFPKGALECGADIVVQSFHKTLPAFSQSAVLHVKGKSSLRLRHCLQCAQSSSPSYMIMAATDYMLNFLWDKPDFFEAYVEALLDFRRCFGDNLVGGPGYDIGKILMIMPDGADGREVAELWAKDLQVEMASASHILAMTSVADTEDGFGLLKKAYGQLLKGKRTRPLQKKLKALSLPEVVVPPRDAIFKASSLDNSQVSDKFVIPHPPGIPVLAPGERI